MSKFTKSGKYKNILFFLSILLFIGINYWIHYLVTNDYVKECFVQERNNGSTSHTVDLPLTSKYSCRNFCGPSSRCITGQQCFADIDCPGCQPNLPPINNNHSTNVIGNNEAGKLTWGQTPQYSSLTSNELVDNSTIIYNTNSPAPQANFGINTWASSAKQGQLLFDERYQPPNNLQFMPKYKKRYELLGDFITDGPLPSNY
jgi:hypothetical protein